MLPNPQDQNVANATQEMLKRATLTGADVPVFVEIHNWLQAIRDGRLIVIVPQPAELQPEPAVAPATVPENEKAPELEPEVAPRDEEAQAGFNPQSAQATKQRK